jgi:shikimate kinase
MSEVGVKASIVYLVGFMGAGKTAVGRRLAELLAWPFLDLDQEIEKREGTTVIEIFQRRGENYFRALEREELQRVSREVNTVVAVGGGGFCSAENQEIIARTGAAVWLEAPIELLFARCSRDASTRPLFASIEEMAQLLEARRPFYAKASLRVQVAGLDVDGLARKIQNDLLDAVPWKPK